MKIVLRPFGILQNYLGGNRIEVACPTGITFSQFCEVIDDRWGKRMPPGLWNAETRRFAGHVIIMINGKDLNPQEDPVLLDGEEIRLLTPMAGG